MSELKTNVSIKFNSIEQYREIEKKLEELGYVNDMFYNEFTISDFKNYSNLPHFVRIYQDKEFVAGVHDTSTSKTYNNLEEFLNDK